MPPEKRAGMGADAHTPDEWPQDPEHQSRLVVALHASELIRLGPLDSDFVRHEQIVDLARDRLLRRARDKNPPAKPRAWFRQVVDNLLKSAEVPRHHPRTLEADPAVDPMDPDRAQEEERARQLQQARRAWLRAALPAFRSFLSGRSLDALEATVSEDTAKAAARRARMDPAHYRRTIGRIATAIREKIEHREVPPPPLGR